MDQMNNTITNPFRQIKAKSRIVSKLTNIINNIGFNKDKGFTFSDHVLCLLKAAENSEPKAKSKIENHLVKMGEEVIPFLVQALTETQGKSRGLAAMALIRIGEPAIGYLEQVTGENSELKWVYEYIIAEIKGTEREIIQSSTRDAELDGVLVG